MRPAWEQPDEVDRRESTQADGQLLMRPASAADAPAIQAFVRNLSPETRRKRFFGPIVELSPQQLERLTERASPADLNLLVFDGRAELIGMAQCVVTERTEAEFALVVADHWQRRGVGTAACRVLIEHARDHHLACLAGFVLSENRAMLGLAAKLGFSLARDSDATLTRAVMAVAPPALQCSVWARLTPMRRSAGVPARRRARAGLALSRTG